MSQIRQNGSNHNGYKSKGLNLSVPWNLDDLSDSDEEKVIDLSDEEEIETLKHNTHKKRSIRNSSSIIDSSDDELEELRHENESVPTSEPQSTKRYKSSTPMSDKLQINEEEQVRPVQETSPKQTKEPALESNPQTEHLTPQISQSIPVPTSVHQPFTPNISSGFIPGVPPALPPGIQGFPQVLPQGPPQGFLPNMPPNTFPQFPPGIPFGLPTGIPPGFPPGLPLNFPPGVPPMFPPNFPQGMVPMPIGPGFIPPHPMMPAFPQMYPPMPFNPQIQPQYPFNQPLPNTPELQPKSQLESDSESEYESSRSDNESEQEQEQEEQENESEELYSSDYDRSADNYSGSSSEDDEGERSDHSGNDSDENAEETSKEKPMRKCFGLERIRTLYARDIDEFIPDVTNSPFAVLTSDLLDSLVGVDPVRARKIIYHKLKESNHIELELGLTFTSEELLIEHLLFELTFMKGVLIIKQNGSTKPLNEMMNVQHNVCCAFCSKILLSYQVTTDFKDKSIFEFKGYKEGGEDHGCIIWVLQKNLRTYTPQEKKYIRRKKNDQKVTKPKSNDDDDDEEEEEEEEEAVEETEEARPSPLSLNGQPVDVIGVQRMLSELLDFNTDLLSILFKFQEGYLWRILVFVSRTRDLLRYYTVDGALDLFYMQLTKNLKDGKHRTEEVVQSHNKIIAEIFRDLHISTFSPSDEHFEAIVEKTFNDNPKGDIKRLAAGLKKIFMDKIDISVEKAVEKHLKDDSNDNTFGLEDHFQNLSIINMIFRCFKDKCNIKVIGENGKRIDVLSNFGNPDPILEENEDIILKEEVKLEDIDFDFLHKEDEADQILPEDNFEIGTDEEESEDDADETSVDQNDKEQVDGTSVNQDGKEQVNGTSIKQDGKEQKDDTLSLYMKNDRVPDRDSLGIPQFVLRADSTVDQTVRDFNFSATLFADRINDYLSHTTDNLENLKVFFSLPLNKLDLKSLRFQKAIHIDSTTLINQGSSKTLLVAGMQSYEEIFIPLGFLVCDKESSENILTLLKTIDEMYGEVLSLKDRQFISKNSKEIRNGIANFLGLDQEEFVKSLKYKVCWIHIRMGLVAKKIKGHFNHSIVKLFQTFDQDEFKRLSEIVDNSIDELVKKRNQSLEPGSFLYMIRHEKELFCRSFGTYYEDRTSTVFSIETYCHRLRQVRESSTFLELISGCINSQYNSMMNHFRQYDYCHEDIPPSFSVPMNLNMILSVCYDIEDEFVMEETDDYVTKGYVLKLDWEAKIADIIKLFSLNQLKLGKPITLSYLDQDYIKSMMRKYAEITVTRYKLPDNNERFRYNCSVCTVEAGGPIDWPCVHCCWAVNQRIFEIANMTFKWAYLDVLAKSKIKQLVRALFNNFRRKRVRQVFCLKDEKLFEFNDSFIANYKKMTDLKPLPYHVFLTHTFESFKETYFTN